MVIERARKVNKRIEQIGLGDNKRFENLFVEDSVKRAFKETILSGDITKLKAHKEELTDVISNLLPENLTEEQIKDYVISSLLEMGQMFVEPKLEGVNPRILFNYMLNNMEKEVKKEKKEMYVIYIDAVGLGKINQKYTEFGGDVMLQIIIESVQEEFNSSKFEIVRLGGDEFGIAVAANNEAEAEFMIQKALTKAREKNLVERIKKEKENKKDSKVNLESNDIIKNGPERDKADFRYGISEYDPKNKRDSIDRAKGISEDQAEKYQETVNDSEGEAEKKEKAQRDLVKEERKKNSMEKFIEIFSNTVTQNKDIKYEMIRQKEPDKSRKCQINGNKVGIDFINSYLRVVKALYSDKKLERVDIDKVKEELEDLYGWNVEDLLDNFLEFSQFFRVKSQNSAQAHAQDDFLDIIKGNKRLKAKVIEFSNLKLINSARGHEGGNRYIEDVFQMIESALANGEDKGAQNYYLRKSGNAIIVFYDERNVRVREDGKEEGVFADLKKLAENYQMDDSTLALNLYMEDLEITYDSETLDKRYAAALENISKKKDEERESTIQIMKTKKGIELYYDRSLFTLDELKQDLSNNQDKLANLQGLIEDLDKIERSTREESVKLEVEDIKEKINTLKEKINNLSQNEIKENKTALDKALTMLSNEEEKSQRLEISNLTFITDDDLKALIELLAEQQKQLTKISETVDELEKEKEQVSEQETTQEEGREDTEIIAPSLDDED